MIFASVGLLSGCVLWYHMLGATSTATHGSNGSMADSIVALGLLSAAGAAEKSNAAQYRARRAQIRKDASAFPALGQRVILRFVLAGAPTATNRAVLELARKEAAQTRDLIFLNTTEGRFTCSGKYLLWLRTALALFPSAAFVGLGDDDVYINLDHLAADLDLVSKLPGRSPSGHVLWGLLMWKAYYNNETMVTSTGFTGWGFTDWAAVAQRSRMEACRATALAAHHTGPLNASIKCAGLRDDHIRAAQQGSIGSPPFPMVNGPLMVISRSLAAVVAFHDYPPRWLKALQRTPRIREALSRPGGPRKSGYACWPVGDSIIGHWVSHIGVERNESITLVNTPLMVQHHPWPSSIRGRFGNTSIVLHGLKKPGHERFRELAIARGSGAFVPYPRVCDTCVRMGWSTWPNSPMGAWQCCGARVEARQLKRACRGRMCPRSAARGGTVGSDSPAPGALHHEGPKSLRLVRDALRPVNGQARRRQGRGRSPKGKMTAHRTPRERAQRAHQMKSNDTTSITTRP